MQFNANTQSKEAWIEPNQKRIMKLAETLPADAASATITTRTCFNKSSVKHDIISNKEKLDANSAATPSILNRNLYNHKTSISDFFKEGSSFTPHVQPDCKDVYDQSKHVFKRLTGYCTFYRDAELKHKNCELKPPLRASKMKK